MDFDDQEILQVLLEMYKDEAADHVQKLSEGCFELEKSADHDRRMASIETMQREAHSLKGASAAVNKSVVESICQRLESSLASVKRGQNILTRELIELYHTTVELLEECIKLPDGQENSIFDRVRSITRQLQSKESGQNTKGFDLAHMSREEIMEAVFAEEEGERKGHTEVPAERPDISTETLRLEESPVAAGNLPSPQAASAPSGSSKNEHEQIRVSVERMNNLFLHAEEMITAKLISRRRVAELQKLKQAITGWEEELTRVYAEFGANGKRIRGGGQRSEENGRDESARFKAIIDDFREAQKEIGGQVSEMMRQGAKDLFAINTLTDNLFEDVRGILMYPVHSLMEVFPRYVRDTAIKLGKQIDLSITGEEFEIDRRLFDEIRDPLMHLIRNCIDHGIEKVQDRTNKPERGNIGIRFAQKAGSRFELTVSDDGSGFDLERIKNTAARNGLIDTDAFEQLDRKEQLAFVFKSGFSTSPIITELSGRGLGMSIVKDTVERLGGTIEIQTELGAGSVFRIELPMMLSTNRGVVIRSHNGYFVIPNIGVKQIVRVRNGALRMREGRRTFIWRNESVPVFYISELLKYAHGAPEGDSHPEEVGETMILVLLSGMDKRVAVVADEVLGEQEMLVKKLGKQLRSVRGIIGAAVLENGKTALVLNGSDLIDLSGRATGVTGSIKDGEAAIPEKKAKRILVAEDSITSRTLLKNVLETAGYNVSTAVNGLDAIAKLRVEEFDLVISDIEMPGMNGLELTVAIRKESRLLGLPVILVTSLGTDEDKERGIDAGANAYIVKSQFQQNNLLDIMRRLI